MGMAVHLVKVLRPRLESIGLLALVTRCVHIPLLPDIKIHITNLFLGTAEVSGVWSARAEVLIRNSHSLSGLVDVFCGFAGMAPKM